MTSDRRWRNQRSAGAGCAIAGSRPARVLRQRRADDVGLALELFEGAGAPPNCTVKMSVPWHPAVLMVEQRLDPAPQAVGHCNRDRRLHPRMGGQRTLAPVPPASFERRTTSRSGRRRVSAIAFSPQHEAGIDHVWCWLRNGHVPPPLRRPPGGNCRTSSGTTTPSMAVARRMAPTSEKATACLGNAIAAASGMTPWRASARASAASKASMARTSATTEEFRRHASSPRRPER